MSKPQYEFFHFEKYKRPAVSKIESHHERTKEQYASNPDIDPERKSLNYHLIEPADSYNKVICQQVKDAGCRTRKDSVWMLEAFFTASPEFFKGKKKREIREFFEECIKFLEQHQPRETFISAVVHMDEKTPHMHLSFVPLTEDKRLAAKDITGNRKKLTWWQDAVWEYIVQKYPEIERGKSASETHRKHIPPRLFKQMTQLTKQKEKLEALLSDVKLTNYKDRAAQILAFLDKYIPDVEAMDTEMRKYRKEFANVDAEIKALEEENAELAEELAKSQKQSTTKKLQELKLQSDYAEARAILDRIPPEIIRAYAQRGKQKEDVAIE